MSDVALEANTSIRNFSTESGHELLNSNRATGSAKKNPKNIQVIVTKQLAVTY